MRKYFIPVLVAMIVSCTGNQKKETIIETFVDKRAKTDTTLVFQGIRIGDTYDSLFVDSIKKAMPITLYDNDNRKFTFYNLFPSTKMKNGKKIISQIWITNGNEDWAEMLFLLGLYSDKYGDFSYLKITRNHNYIEQEAFIRLGDTNKDTYSPFRRIDAMNTFTAHFNRERSSLDYISYEFVWEWKNQSINISLNHNTGIGKTSVTYNEYGFDSRMKDEQRIKQYQDSVSKSKAEQIEKAKAHQQI